MRSVPNEGADPVTPDAWQRLNPFLVSHSSGPLGWSGVRVEHIPDQTPDDISVPPQATTCLILSGPNDASGRFECDGCGFDGHPEEGSVSLVPAGASSRFRWHGGGGATHFLLSRTLTVRTAVEACDLDPATVRFQPVMNRRVHHTITATLTALRDELLTGGVGGRLCAESLATVLVVHLIRHLAAGPAVRGLTGALARHVVKAVEEYVHDNLDQSISLADLAAVVHLSEFHFARLFKTTTGQTPHQFVIGKRVERAKTLITERRLSLAEVAAEVGFASQSHLHSHFKRLVGCTPKQFGK